MWKMFPSFPSSDQVNVTYGNAKQIGEKSSRCRCKTANSNHVRICQPMIIVVLTILVAISAFVFAVAVILATGSNPKVRRPYTRWIVTAMKHLQSFWNLSEVNEPRGPMRPNWKSLAALDAAVSILILPSGPYPTPAQAGDVLRDRPMSVYFFPESLFKRCGNTLRKSRVLVDNLAHKLVLCPFGLLAQRAFSLCQKGDWAQV